MGKHLWYIQVERQDRQTDIGKQIEQKTKKLHRRTSSYSKTNHKTNEELNRQSNQQTRRKINCEKEMNWIFYKMSVYCMYTGSHTVGCRGVNDG